MRPTSKRLDPWKWSGVGLFIVGGEVSEVRSIRGQEWAWHVYEGLLKRVAPFRLYFFIFLSRRIYFVYGPVPKLSRGYLLSPR